MFTIFGYLLAQHVFWPLGETRPNSVISCPAFFSSSTLPINHDISPSTHHIIIFVLALYYHPTYQYHAISPTQTTLPIISCYHVHRTGYKVQHWNSIHRRFCLTDYVCPGYSFSIVMSRITYIHKCIFKLKLLPSCIPDYQQLYNAEIKTIQYISN